MSTSRCYSAKRGKIVNATIERMMKTTRTVQIVVIIFLCFVMEFAMMNYENYCY